ncbi:unnamed protein product [Rotaria sordida]|uniref:Major facilitator superfamily (MFS) profile domain-containing protein n=1 Tax=Rotaria sordida TaxID=392033 RepID=A0A813VJM6_9BILA|nr:unnamed protein product [Rotaria sordida]CAF3656861.1 unnamed protein product [Rotaria sordida]
MKFDTFLATVGDWGRFQKVKYTIICLTYMLPPIMVYTYTFTAAQPNFRCQNPELMSLDSYNESFNKFFDSKYKPTENQCLNQKKSISLKECERCYMQPSVEFHARSSQSNRQLEPCNKFVFEKVDYEKTLVEEWSLVCGHVPYRSAVQMFFFGGYMVGSIFFGVLADKYGRRPIMSVSFILMSLSGFLSAFGPQAALGFWPSYIIFILARFLLACSTRGISVSGFVLGSEIVGPSKRLLTGIVIEYFFAFGQLLLVCFAYFIRTWRSLTWAISLFTVPFIFFYFILPESPRWLVSKGRFDDAEKVLRYIALKNKRDFDQSAFEQMKEEQEKNMSHEQHQEGIKILFKSRIMFFISINLFFQWLVQNLVFYGVSQSTGSWNLNPYLSFTISALVELLAYAVVQLILDRIGRKLPYISFAILFSFVAFLILPIQKYMTKDSNAQVTLLNIINSTLKFLASGSYAIIYIYANELFPTNVRNTGMGICSMVARIGAIIGTFCNDSLTRIWIHLPVFLYGIVSLVAAILALTFPETLNRPLPQTVADVEQMGLRCFPSHSVESTITVDQALPGNSEEDISKRDLQRRDIADSKL